jgi:hypothetical protein
LASRKLTSGNSCRGLSQQPAQYAWKGKEEKKRGEGKETEPHNNTSRHGRVLMRPTEDVVAVFFVKNNASDHFLPSVHSLLKSLENKSRRVFAGRLQSNTSQFYTVPYLDRFFFFTARTALLQASSCRSAEGWKKLVLISLPSVPNICQKQNCDLGPISLLSARAP